MNYKLTTNFDSQEFDSKCGAMVPSSFRGNVLILAHQLQIMRRFWGLPIAVHSGFRSYAHNKEVKGGKHSYHLLGKAADVSIDGITPLQLFRAFKFAMDYGIIKKGGLAVYSWGIHYDTRGDFVTWSTDFKLD
tara:strand:+ start:1812 stop:2210 length:399 start_codon:yes stop_codon:yes gene_type:complete